MDSGRIDELPQDETSSGAATSADDGADTSAKIESLTDGMEWWDDDDDGEEWKTTSSKEASATSSTEAKNNAQRSAHGRVDETIETASGDLSPSH